MDPKHFGSQFAPLQFSTTMLTSGWPSVRPKFSIWLSILFQKLFWFQIRYQFFVAAPRPVSPDTQRISQNTAHARGKMPEPARIMIAHQAAQRVKNRAKKSDAINPHQQHRT